jgi:hypothetical protein
MEDIRTDEIRAAEHLLVIAFDTMPAAPATSGDDLLTAVGRRHARRRRTRALISAATAAAAAGTAVAVLLSMTVAGATPAFAAVTGALSRASAASFRMNLEVTQRNTVPGYGGMPPLYLAGEFDLKRDLGEETLSNGWLTRIVRHEAYTEVPPAQEKVYGTAGKPWTETPLTATGFPYKSTGAQLAWDLNSDRPFNPEALLAALNAGAKVVDEGPVSGPGWTGTRYKFSLSHPHGTGDVVDSITGTMSVDSQGNIRSLEQSTAFVASGKPGTAGESIYTLDFTFSDFGVRFSVTPPPASQIDPDVGLGVQF